MATSIGSLGRKHDDVDLEFDYFGQTIRVNPEASDLDFMEFMEKANSIDELDEIQSMVATLAFIRKQIHPDDWDTFWTAAKANGQNTLDLLDTSKAILEAVAGFPTGQSSDSLPTPNRAERRSKGGSSSRGRTRQSAATRALRAQKGRPDLQAVTIRRMETAEAV